MTPIPAANSSEAVLTRLATWSARTRRPSVTRPAGAGRPERALRRDVQTVMRSVAVRSAAREVGRPQRGPFRLEPSERRCLSAAKIFGFLLDWFCASPVGMRAVADDDLVGMVGVVEDEVEAVAPAQRCPRLSELCCPTRPGRAPPAQMWADKGERGPGGRSYGRLPRSHRPEDDYHTYRPRYRCGDEQAHR
jgi:hypothetical protein